MFKEVTTLPNTTNTKGFQVKDIFSRWFANRKSRIERRLDKTKDTITVEPQLAARNIHYEVSDKANGLLCGGIGALHLLARRIGLIDDIDRHLHLLKVYLFSAYQTGAAEPRLSR